jgi:NADPH:quinone reductase-like Zn-dependent oxidoreductase
VVGEVREVEGGEDRLELAGDEAGNRHPEGAGGTWIARVSMEVVAELVVWRQAPPQWARHPAWFREDLERLFGLLATRAIRPRVAERISFDEAAEAHCRVEAGGLEGKLVLCADLPSRRDRVPS